MITEKDFDSIKADGRSLELIKRQYEHLVGEKIKISGIRPALIGDGILEMDTKEKNNAVQYFNTNSDKKRWIKFVPASGVASRMFSSLQNYIDNGCETGGGKRNWLSLREKIKVNNEYQTKILCDPQTSGGLLVFVDPKGTKIVKSILEEYELVSSPIGHLEKYTKNNIYIEVCP